MTGRQHLVAIMIRMESESNLFEIVLAGESRRCLADILDGSEQQTDEDADDGDDDQQFEKGESRSIMDRAGRFRFLEP